MRRILRLALLFLIASVAVTSLAANKASTAAQTAPAGPQNIGFDDSAADSMRLYNDAYEITLSKINGAILQIIDRQNGQNLTRGSRNGCLWGAVYPQGTAANNYAGGCHYDRASSQPFSYQWQAATSTLVLSYTGDTSRAGWVDAQVTLTPSTASHLDWQLAIQNHWGLPMESALFPSDLLFSDPAVENAYGMFALPGIRLQPAFFQQDRTYTQAYPASGMFGQYLALDLLGSHWAMYPLSPLPAPLAPLTLGFIDDDAANPDTFYTYFRFQTAVADGASWQSPVVRMHIGQAVQQTVLGYRTGNAIDRYPSLAQKLGDSSSRRLFQQALIKMDTFFIDLPFTQWPTLLAQLPAPALLHPVSFQPRGFDENYPDFLPPAEQWGSTQDFHDMAVAARAAGHFVMPYINPTWWDDQSPTMQNLPDGLLPQALAVQDAAGQPLYEYYSSHGGYVISPYTPFVQQRLAALMAQWETEVPVDCVLEDQIGARSWQRDYNPAAPDVLSYSSGWYAHTQAYTGQCLMTELGWDRLANTEVGFHGSVLVGFMDGDGRWGAGNWSVYPLFGMLAGDKTLLYQHDLAHETMTDNKPVLTFNMSYGYMLSYNWMSADLTPANTPWFDIALSFQEAVASQYAGKQITSFSQPGPGLTQTGYGHLSVLANWNTAATYPTQGYEIAPQGFLAIDSDNSLLAGIFSGQFNGQALSAGEHYLIVRRSDRTVYVRQPLGEDTQLWVPLPKNWQAGERLVVGAYTHLGKYLGEVPYTLNGSTVNFRYQRTLGVHTVGYYQVSLVRRSYLPLG